MRILGISYGLPVASAVLIEEGRVLRAAAQERFTGLKRDPSFPYQAIEFVKGGREPQVYSLVGEGSFDFPLSEDIHRYPLGLSMAASSFFASPFDKAGILVVDFMATEIYRGEGTEIQRVEGWDFPNTLGLFCSAITQFLGFSPGEGDYKVMGLAGYGKARFVEELRRALEIYPGGFSLNPEFFGAERNRFFKPGFVSLLKTPPASSLQRPLSPYADVAASAQAVFEEALISLAKKAMEASGSRNLVLAGSQALNGLANYRLVKELGVNLYIQPEAGEGGASLGAGYLAWVERTGQRPLPLLNPFLGKDYRECLQEALEKSGLRWKELSRRIVIEKTAEALSAGKVVGWFRGRFEWGPRALGARSILADPRKPEMKDIVNLRIKRREPFRPFAPTVLRERAGEFFSIPEGGEFPLMFMQMVVPVLSSRIPAVTHADRTARPQSLSKEFNPDFYDLIKAFGEATGVAVVLNTSFNLKGKPIVADPQQAISTFLETDLDALVLENFWIEKG